MLGELFLTVGVIVALNVGWTLWYLPAVTGREQAAVVADLHREFDARSPSTSWRRPAAGAPFAVLHIPRLQDGRWRRPVYEGVSARELSSGLGHYPSTAYPGEVGNSAFAGHRAGHGSPLIDIDILEPGDSIVIESVLGYDVYRITGHAIIEPDDVSVLLPLPDAVRPTARRRWLTLTTCSPRYGSSQRYVVFASFEQRRSRAEGMP